ncbi:MAG TPA: hypothetical protein VHY08_28745, partial [Bacillota bacterium]|nr:hypothetical protein [Bacillota bacterium]
YDEWNHYRIVVTPNNLEIFVNGVSVFNRAGTYSPRNYIRFRDFGYCTGPVTNYIDNVSVRTGNDEDFDPSYFPGWGLSWTISTTHGTKFEREDNAAKITHIPFQEGLDYIQHDFDPLANAIIEFDAKIGSENNNWYSLVVESAPNGLYDPDGFWMSFNANYLQILKNGWENIAMITFDEWNHYRIVVTPNNLEVFVNGVSMFNREGTYSPRNFIRFRDYGYCGGPVTNYVDNVKITTIP